MSIELTASERIARIRSDFRMGVAVAFRSGLEKWLVASSETITLSRFNGMRKLGPFRAGHNRLESANSFHLGYRWGHSAIGNPR